MTPPKMKELILDIAFGVLFTTFGAIAIGSFVMIVLTLIRNIRKDE